MRCAATTPLQTGNNITTPKDDGTFRAPPCLAPVGLHQLGAGYDHHVSFTHSCGDTDHFYKITGWWQVGQAQRRSACRRPVGARGGRRRTVQPRHANTMATGYTGKDFLSRLSKDWELKLDKPVQQEMPDGNKRTMSTGEAGTG